MTKDIKTRNVKKDIKTISKSAGSNHTVKTATIKARGVVEEEAAPKTKDRLARKSYAEDKTQEAIEQGGAHAVRGAKSAAIRAKRAHSLSKDAAKVTARRSTKVAADAQASAKTEVARASKNAIKQAKASGIKKTSKSVKSSGRAAKTAARTAQKTAQTTKATATVSKITARNAAQTARTGAKAAHLGVKAAARGVAAFARMAIAAAKSLGAAIAASGGLAACVIIIICLVGLIAASAFGIFFTGGDMGDGNPTLREVITEINDEHTAKIEEIKAANPHDDLALTGSKTAWRETLALYAVKTTTDVDNPLDVVTLDSTRQALLRTVFWDMNAIEHRIEERETTEIVLEVDEDGVEQEVAKTSTVKTLYIVLSNKSSDDVASSYGFNQGQMNLLHEMLGDSFNSAWQSVLYGISRGSGDIVEIAIEQLGNVGGQPYWSWYGFSGRVEWCACFVSWCANEAGYIESGVIPKFSYCPTGVQWFKSTGLWKDRGYEPQPGDIIFFDWEGDGVSDHVGIVESCDKSAVYTIEGNTGDSCARRSYGVNSNSIMGYGTPLY